MSWLHNLQTTIPFQDPEAPLSQPGCWAYPDMLEVGRIRIDGQLHVPWNRAHFGAWAVTSAPLILGLDIRQSDVMAQIVDIITNAEVIAVNQAWAGHPGRLVWQQLGGALGFPAARPCDIDNPSLHQVGWHLEPLPTSGPVAGKTDDKVALVGPGGGCLEQRGGGYPGGAGALVLSECNASKSVQQFTYNASTGLLRSTVAPSNCVDVHGGGPIVWMYGCNEGSTNDKLTIDTVNGTAFLVGGQMGDGRCIGVEAADPAGGGVEAMLQAWAKPLPGHQGLALLLINPDDAKPHAFNVPLHLLPLTGGGVNLTTTPFAVRDLWAHKDLAHHKRATVGGNFTLTVGPLDSAFVRLYPTPAV